MIVIIIGMHRSGTSALAGLLHNSNLIMGEEKNLIPKPSQENIKGFYENYLFRRINDHIVEKCGYAIKSWDTKVPQMSANFLTRYRMRRILKQYNERYDKWGWKDPRTCLTLGLWLKEIEKLDFSGKCKLLYIMRDPYAVASSMVKRDNTNFENGLKLWLVYNQYALAAIDSFNISTHYLTYENLIKNPIETSQSFSSFLEHPIHENTVNQFIDSKLNRSTSDEYKENLSSELTLKLKSIKEQISDRID